MGASASISPLRSLLGESLTEAYLKENLGDNFDPIDFAALKNENNEVPKDLLVSVHLRGAEFEVFALFKEFCPGLGAMNIRDFIRFFEDCKLLKKNFSRQHAEKLFHQARFRVGEMQQSINYYLFREEVVPEYCRLRGLQEGDLMESLSRCAGPTQALTEAEHMKDFRSLGQSLYMASAAVAANSGKEIMTSGKVEAPEAEAIEVAPEANAEDVAARLKRGELEAEQAAAALKLQKIARGKVARQKLRDMKEIEAIRNNTHADSPVVDEDMSSHLIAVSSEEGVSANSATRASENEVCLNIAFSLFCKPSTPEEMDIRDFVRLWKDINVLTRRFTSVEAERIFRKVVAKLQSLGESDPLKKSLRFDKRIDYIAFRTVAVAMVAKSKSKTLDDFVADILPSVMDLQEQRCAAA